MHHAAKSGVDDAAKAFVEKWSKVELSERAASHEHFLDLCRLLDQPTPVSADATGEDYCFEKHVKVVGSASKGSKGDFGFVDVWKRGHFAWEYKRKDKHKTLDEAYRQVHQYRDDLDNPPLSVVCDIRTTEIRAHFPGYPTEKTVIKLEEIPGRLDTLRRAFTNPHSFKPLKTREQMTGDLAKSFGELADKLLSRNTPVPATLFHGHGDPVAHFLMKVMFCLFAEDVALLPDKVFTKLVDRCMSTPEAFKPSCAELFEKMKRGGHYGNDRVDQFNGGLFDDAEPLSMTHAEMPILLRAAGQQWGAVEPSIFGTLFERILDPKKRAQIGAHYTSKADILLLVEPVVMTPLRRKWADVQEQIAPDLAKVAAEKDRKKRDLYSAPVRKAIDELRRQLGAQRILDPACGSGNFLYVALQQLLDLDDEIVRFAARYDIPLNPFPYIRPTQLHGIEINPYAAELAQNVIWIGYLQWLAEHHIDNPKRPILDKLVSIEHRDAILDLTKPNLPTPAQWPEADFIIGNPPFLGGSRIWEGLGTDYRDALWRAHDIPKFSDLCCYWFDLARERVEAHPHMRVGLLATQGIRGKTNREVLDRIARTHTIFNAWSDRNWILDGAAVHVSIICFTKKAKDPTSLNGAPVDKINTDLTSEMDATSARQLAENDRLSFIGTKKAGLFNIPYDQARHMLALPRNPNGQHNRDVLLPWASGSSLAGRWDGTWIIDFGVDRTKADASLYETPFKHALEHVKPDRDENKRKLYREKWWLHAETRPGLRAHALVLPRCLGVTRHSKHLPFAWVDQPFLPDDGVFVFARADDYFFGALQSSVHALWARRTGTQVREAESGFRYTPSTTFEAFPLPWPPGKEDVKHPAYQRIAVAAKGLNEQRERWLNPPEWIEPLAARIDAADSFSDIPPAARALVRHSAIMAAAAKDARLKKRTLTNLYNERPTWLKLAHEQLDRSVLAAYAATDTAGGWSEDWAIVWTDTGAGQPLPADHELAAERAEVDQRVLANLLRLNHERARRTAVPADAAKVRGAQKAAKHARVKPA